MPTVKEIKESLDACGVEYSSKDKKADLEKMLVLFQAGVEDEERPRNIKAEAPDYIVAGDDFIDPNADLTTQAQ